MVHNLKSQYDDALKQFVERHRKNPNVLAILVSGSYIHSEPDKNSDLDVYIVLEKEKMRERGNVWINGVEIEYFINSVDQVRYYLKTEVGDKSPCTAHMFANSIVLYQKDKVINQLIKEAKAIIIKKMPKMNRIELECARYGVDDTRKDLEDVYLKKDIFAFSILANDLLSECLRIFYRVHRKPKEKSKRLRDNLKKLDIAFEQLFSEAVQKQNITEKYKAINKVVDYIENLLGGKRPKTWKIRSKSTV